MNQATFMDVRTKPRKLGVKLPRSAGRLAAGVVLLCGVLLLSSTAAVAQVGSWTTGSVTTNGDTNNFVAVTTDSSGNFHGAWRPASGATGFIAIGAWNGTGWTPVSSFSPSDSSLFQRLSDDVSLAVDSLGHYHVAFNASRGDNMSGPRGIFYAKYDGTSWTFDEVQTSSDSSGWKNYDDPRVDIDSSNNPHLTYQFSDVRANPRVQYLRYAVKTASWSISNVDTLSGGDEIDNGGFALDSANKAHVSYTKERGDSWDADLMYATNATGAFVPAVLKAVGNNDVAGPGVGGTDLELDSSGNVHISFSFGEYAASSVRYMTNAGGSFAETTAVGNGSHGYPNAIGVKGAADLKVIVYRDSDSSPSSVRAATKVGAAAWQDEQVWYNAGDDFGTGSYLDAAMNSSGQIMILFHRNSDGTGDDRRVMFAFGSLSAAVCGNGIVEPGEACDGGACCTGSCAYAASGANCGSDASACSGQDTCNGSGSCQANHLSAGTNCGDAGTECVNQDSCDGSGSCTDNGFVSSGTNCGSGPSECSGQDTCNGAGACQVNDFASGTNCGDAGTECVNQDSCDGAGSCSDNGFVAAGSGCGDPFEDDCDGADICDGSGTCDANLEADGTGCDDSDICTTSDACAGGVCVGGPDETDPTIDCSGIDEERSTDPGVCSFTMPGTGFDPTFDDNCPGASLSNDYNGGGSLAGASFAEGTTAVDWTVTDGAGATAGCSLDIVITDDELPTIACPADVESEPTSATGASVAYPAPVIGDNCPGATSVCIPASGSLFAIGDTEVICTVTDDSGNEGSCSFFVTVLDAGEVIDNLVDDLLALEADGVLNGGQSNALTRKLGHATRAINRDKLNVACNTLAAFIHHATALVDAVLTAAEAQALIDSATNARAALGCVSLPAKTGRTGGSDR